MMSINVIAIQKESVKTPSSPICTKIFVTLNVKWRNSTPHFVLLPERENEINLFPQMGSAMLSRYDDLKKCKLNSNMLVNN